MVTLLLACAAEIELLDHTAWSAEGCSVQAFNVEAGSLELDTNECSPVRVTQPLDERIRDGDTLELVWWHDFLFTEEPAQGVFTVSIDDRPVYTITREIPGPPLAETVTFAALAGEELAIEVANHGANTWDVLRLTRIP